MIRNTPRAALPAPVEVSDADFVVETPEPEATVDVPDAQELEAAALNALVAEACELKAIVNGSSVSLGDLNDVRLQWLSENSKSDDVKSGAALILKYRQQTAS